MVSIIVFVVAGATATGAFPPTIPSFVRQQQQHSSIITSLSSKLSSTVTNNEEMGGVDEFESWYRSLSDDDTTKYIDETTRLIRHGSFVNGRGLQYLGSSNTSNNDEEQESATIAKDEKEAVVNELFKRLENNKQTTVMTIPKRVVLSSTMVQDVNELESIADDWDVGLALQLLTECQLGPDSNLYGYCCLLTRSSTPLSSTNTTNLPSSTAPDAIRNWTELQQERLQQTARGRKLLSIVKEQQDDWTAKYNALVPEQQEFTKEQFVWAMEAVHSRAFKGDFGILKNESTALTELSKQLVPLAALIFGVLFYLQSNPYIGDAQVVGLLALASTPLLLNIVNESLTSIDDSDMDAVLLPFIDSANHQSNAPSVIEFNPINRVFTASFPTTSLDDTAATIATENDDQQLYISYGTKSDAELLLNYGFLEDLPTSLLLDNEQNYQSKVGSDGIQQPRDGLRKLLAETFLERE